MIDAETRGSWDVLTSKLKGFVSRRVRDTEADDVLQDVLLRIQRSLPDLRDDQLFGPWVYRVARSAVADHLRGRARGPAVAPSSAALEQATELSDDEDEVQQGLLACLGQFIAKLPAPYRQAVTLTELEGLTQEEAATMLGLSLSGMKSRVQRGRRQLREMFEGCCVLSQDVRGRVIACEPRSFAELNVTGCSNDRACSLDKTNEPGS
jgi:RNA polymerase sigma-70 factor (ECF subfamily)